MTRNKLFRYGRTIRKGLLDVLHVGHMFGMPGSSLDKMFLVSAGNSNTASEISDGLSTK